MTTPVYHFTDTARLPWIVAAGELRPGRNQIGGYPVDFLWATTNLQGDRTASAMQGYRHGHTAFVRLTLHAEDFEAWPTILERFPQWTSEHVWGLEAFARKRGVTDFRSWRTRADALPLDHIIEVEAKTFTGSWTSLDIDLNDVCLKGRNPDMRGVLLNNTVYASIQHIEPGQPTTYSATKMSLDEWRRAAVVAA